jgi:hypothetical protein
MTVACRPRAEAERGETAVPLATLSELLLPRSKHSYYAIRQSPA